MSAVLGTANAQTVSFDIIRADIDNVQSDALTLASYSATSNLIDLNHDRDIKTQLNLALRQSDALDPYVDFVAVWLNREWDDGRTVQRDQLGLFGIRVPPGTRTVERADAVYTGYDLTATLARYAFTEAYNIAASANYVTAALDILDLAGFTRAAIEPTSTVTPAVVSFPVGTTYLAACNTLLQSIGYYTLACLPDGTFFSMPTRPLHLVEPYRVITDDDLMAPVEVQPPKIRYEDSYYNVVMYGYRPASYPIVETIAGTSGYNELWDNTHRRIFASGTLGGLITENTSDDNNAVFTVMSAGAAKNAADVTAAYVAQVGAKTSKYKQASDTYPRVQIDHVNGRTYYGNGLSAVANYIGAFGSVGLQVSGYIRAGTVASLPSASSAYRGMWIRIEGGSGVKDSLYVCRKTTSDAYEWVELA